jgi:hypothetical protein
MVELETRALLITYFGRTLRSDLRTCVNAKGEGILDEADTANPTRPTCEGLRQAHVTW